MYTKWFRVCIGTRYLCTENGSSKEDVARFIEKNYQLSKEEIEALNIQELH